MFAFISATVIITVLLIAVFVWYGFYVVSVNTLAKTQHRRLFTAVSTILWGWVWLSFTLSINGFFTLQQTPNLMDPFPNLLLLILPAWVTIALLWLVSPSFQQVINAIPQKWFIEIQLPRAIGLVFVFLMFLDLLPAVFGYPAGIGDFLTGAAVPFVLYIYLHWSMKRARWVVLGWNIFGMLDLFTAFTLGFLSIPGTPFHMLALNYQGQHIITQFPIAIIPTFAVPLYLVIHTFSLRQAKREWHLEQSPDATFNIPNPQPQTSTP